MNHIFMDNLCRSRTDKKMTQDQQIYFFGWNENDDFDAIESDCYGNKNDAEQKLNELKESYCRKEWCIDKYMIGECKWQEGFVKVHH